MWVRTLKPVESAWLVMSEIEEKSHLNMTGAWQVKINKRPTPDPQTRVALTEMPAAMIFESDSRLMVSRSPAGWGTGAHRPVCQNVGWLHRGH